MNEKISVFTICAEAITYLLIYNLHGRTFKTIFNQFLYCVLHNTLFIIRK